jgi:hypothetical protein
MRSHVNEYVKNLCCCCTHTFGSDRQQIAANYVLTEAVVVLPSVCS